MTRFSSIRALLGVALLATTAAGFDMHGFDFGPKPKHEWTYEEFKEHREKGRLPHPKPFAEVMEGLKDQHPDMVKHDVIGEDSPYHPEHGTPTTEHHEFRAKSEEEKRAHYEEHLAEAKAEKERKEYEASLRYQLYYFFFHFKGGVFGLFALGLKLTAIAAGCWCLSRHKAKRFYNEGNLSGPFSRRSVRTVKKD